MMIFQAQEEKMPNLIRLFVLAGTLLLASCAIQQKVRPISGLESKTACIRESPEVRAGFLPALRGALEGRGWTVKTLPPSATLSDCPVVITYTASWSWDLALYMSYAEIKVFRSGQLTGDALYDSRRGGGRLDKFIEAEAKIKELVAQLFP